MTPPGQTSEETLLERAARRTAARAGLDSPPDLAPPPTPVSEVPATETGETLTVPLAGPRNWAALDRMDVALVTGFLLVAFVLRFFSPIMPDILQYGFTRAPVTNCVNPTPTHPQGRLGAVCGLAYPFQRGYPPNSTNPQPPNGQVFDEIYFATFAHNDLKGIAYFDPEPPLSKLIIAAGEWGYGEYRKVFEGARGDPADLGFNTFGWRIMSCIFGTLVVGMMYLLARRLWPQNRVFAIAAATLTCFDGMFFIQSRIGMIDIFPIFFIVLGYWVFLLHLNSRTRRESLLTMLVLGLVMSLAISAKWISLAALATMVFVLVVRAVRRRLDIAVDTGAGTWTWGRREAVGPAVPGAVYWPTYVAVAIASLAVMPVLIYILSWIPFFTRGQFHTLGDLLVYTQQTFEYHKNLTATHPYGSRPIDWLFMRRPVAYYFESQGLGVDRLTGNPLVAGMVDLGNPWIWWTSLPCLLSMVVIAVRERSFPAALFLVAFTTQYLPWWLITRVIFMYHMFGSLPWMILALAFVLGRAADLRLFSYHRSDGSLRIVTGRWLAYAHLAVAVAFFAYFYPVWTGLPISNTAYLNGFLLGGKMWLQSWI